MIFNKIGVDELLVALIKSRSIDDIEAVQFSSDNLSKLKKELRHIQRKIRLKKNRGLYQYILLKIATE